MECIIFKKKFIKNNDTGICFICFGICYRNNYKLECGCKFNSHYRCLKKAIKTCKGKCPICRVY